MPVEVAAGCNESVRPAPSSSSAETAYVPAMTAMTAAAAKVGMTQRPPGRVSVVAASTIR